MYGSLEKGELYIDSDSTRHSEDQRGNRINFAVSVAVFVVSILTLSTYISKGISKSNLKFNTITTSVEDEISVSNPDYESTSSTMFAYPFLDGAYLMEPLRINIVKVNVDDSSLCAVPSVTNGACYISWSLEGGNVEQTLTGCSESNSFNVIPPSTGQYSLSIKMQCADGSYSAVGQYSIWVKYVRREVRSLTDTDREEFLDAFRTLWDVSTVDGVARFGPKYKSLFYLASVHNDAGGSPLCDEFHGNAGYGFVNNHVFLSSFLEQSLQLVNPRVALHYIDYFEIFSSEAYTVTHLKNSMDGGAWSDILTDKFFGTSDPITGRIINSRWESTSIPVVDEAFFLREGIDNTQPFFDVEKSDWESINTNHRSSPYGLLRAPWNFNPSAFTTRYGNVNQLSFEGVSFEYLRLYQGATCAMLENYIKSYVKDSSLKSMLETAEDNTHGNIHFAFGGSGGDTCALVDKQLQDDYGFTTTDLIGISLASQTAFKVQSPTSTPYIDAATGTCVESYFQTEDSFTELVNFYFMAAPVKDVLAYLLNQDLPLEERSTAMRLICNRKQYDSEMEGSGAATDPLFWVSHGNVERLHQKIMLEDILADKEYPTSGAQCSGHAHDGVKPWLKGFYFEDSSVDASTLTNVDLTAVLDPTGPLYPKLVNYVYDSGKWTCDGFDSWF